MMTKDQADRWLAHPMVQRAFEQAEAQTGASDPLLALEMLSDTMLDLETRFPGRSFAEILTPERRYDKGKMLKTLLAYGWDEREAKELLDYGKCRVAAGDRQVNDGTEATHG